MSTATSDTERKVNKVEPSSIQKDQIMALTYYVKVASASNMYGQFRMTVNDLDNGIRDIQVQGDDLIRNSFSADYFAEEQKVSKTKAAEILVSSHGRPFTVVYEKQDGTERTLRGRLLSAEPLLGRSRVEDLDEPAGKRVRQVDHRTIRSLILEGVKYVVPPGKD